MTQNLATSEPDTPATAAGGAPVRPSSTPWLLTVLNVAVATFAFEFWLSDSPGGGAAPSEFEYMLLFQLVPFVLGGLSIRVLLRWKSIAAVPRYALFDSAIPVVVLCGLYALFDLSVLVLELLW